MIPFFVNQEHQWLFLLGISVFFLMRYVRQNFGMPLALLFGTCAGSSLWVWIYSFNRYRTINVYDQQALKLFACDSLAKTLLVAVPLMLYSRERFTFRLIGEFLCSLFVLCSSIVAIAEYFAHGCADNMCGGLIGNPSISLSCSVCMLPVFIKSWRRQKIVLGLTILAAFLSQSSIAAGLLAVYAFLWVAPMMKRKFLSFLLSGGIAGGIMGAARLCVGAELFNSSGRFSVWKYMMHAWSAPWNILFGTGWGTYHVFSINLQHAWGNNLAGKDWWNTFHNDWLQQVFEVGLVGGFLMLLTYGHALLKLLREDDWPMFVSIVLYGLYMFFNPALHNPIPILFGAWAFVYALRHETKELTHESLA